MFWLLGFATVIALIAAYVHSSLRLITGRRQPDAETRPDQFGLAYEEVAFQAPDGVQLRGWWIPAKEARATLIFCHGQAGSMDRDTGMVRPFCAMGFNVLTFDFRGHGRSEGQVVTLGPLERSDLLAAVDFLAARGIERVGVIGWSMGGAVAISAAKVNSHIAAVVADSAFASLARVLTGEMQRRSVPHMLAKPLVRLTLLYAKWRLRIDLEANEPRREVNHQFRCPLLLIQGDADPYIPLEDALKLARASGGPVDLWRVPGAGHREARECYPDEYRARVLAFFERWLVRDLGRESAGVNGKKNRSGPPGLGPMLISSR